MALWCTIAHWGRHGVVPCKLRPTSQQDTIEYMQFKQKYGHRCGGDLNVHVGTRDVTVWARIKQQVL